MASGRRKRIWLAQQGVWDMAFESMPLACGYLKAAADADDDLKKECDIRIFNFGGGDSALRIVQRLFYENVPDILALSVFGWNYPKFGIVSETFKQFNPKGWVVLGGTHVTNQARRIFPSMPWVDVIVNGEGELTFKELLRAYLLGTSQHELDEVAGISFKRQTGEIINTPDRPRITDLDVIPSPFLTGAIPMTDARGDLRYDVALMETNRGCPYKCAFCYWGGAIGQRIRSFSIDRLREELEFFAHHKVVNVVLCDANFGMLKQDLEFIDAAIALRKRHGFPKNVESCWAKNKGPIFMDIVRRMKQAGLHSSFTLALQSLSAEAVRLMRRTNMKLNEWEDLANWLHREGLNLYAELIWGVPGETYDSFIEGYDRLAQYVSRIATYPHLLIPNTEFSEHRDEHQFVSIRGEKDDFEYVLAHRTMTVQDNERMHRFLFWARVIGEYMVYRRIWSPLRTILGITQSEVLLSLDRWVDRQSDPISRDIQACRNEVVSSLDASRVTRGIHYFATQPGIGELFQRWWSEEILPRTPQEMRAFFEQLHEYDWLTRPIYGVGPPSPSQPSSLAWRSFPVVPREDLEIVEFGRETYYFRRDVRFDYDVPQLVRCIIRGDRPSFAPSPVVFDLYYKTGFEWYVDNHEQYPQFMGKTLTELEEAEAMAEVETERGD